MAAPHVCTNGQCTVIHFLLSEGEPSVIHSGRVIVDKDDIEKYIEITTVGSAFLVLLKGKELACALLIPLTQRLS